MGTNTILFHLDTIQTNFIEYFLEKGYDIWLFDTRLSTNCPWISALHNYSIDDMINYDMPAVVDKVLEITKEVGYYAHTYRLCILPEDIQPKVVKLHPELII